MPPMIIYEQPLNEAIRACLRLEHCFKQAAWALHQATPESIPTITTVLLDLLDVVDRPDLKSKLTASLLQHQQFLQRLINHPQVDTMKIHALLESLDEHLNFLRNLQSSPGQALQNHPFLRTLRQQAASPGGICDFCVPAYQMWRHFAPSMALSQCQHWLSTFDPLKNLVDWLLTFTRQSQPWRDHHTPDGFYRQPLDSQTDWQLIRVALAANTQAFPQISIGKHGLAVHFLTATIATDKTSQDTVEDVSFRISCHGL